MTADYIFGSIMTNGMVTGVTFLVSTFASLAIGIFIAFMYTLKNSYSKSFFVTLSLIPAIVQIIIMLVNGNLGVGVAVAGAFSLVKFRSAPGAGKEITSIFLAMASGLATGMGYIGIAVIFVVILSLVTVILNSLHIGENEKLLRITIPEGLDFEGIFDDILAKYTTRSELQEVRTYGMGSLYRLSYKIIMQSGASTKSMIDEMRVRNGNLEISCSRTVAIKTEEL